MEMLQIFNENGLVGGTFILFITFVFVVFYKIIKVVPQAIERHFDMINELTEKNNKARQEDREAFTESLNNITNRFIEQLNTISKNNTEAFKRIEDNHNKIFVKLENIHNDVKSFKTK